MVQVDPRDIADADSVRRRQRTRMPAQEHVMMARSVRLAPGGWLARSCSGRGLCCIVRGAFVGVLFVEEACLSRVWRR